jgi:hypothetical protein
MLLGEDQHLKGDNDISQSCCLGANIKSLEVSHTLCLQDGWTPLHRAAWNGHEDVVVLLLDRGANVDAANRVSDFTTVC